MSSSKKFFATFAPLFGLQNRIVMTGGPIAVSLPATEIEIKGAGAT
jgi:hypothetical protein